MATRCRLVIKVIQPMEIWSNTDGREHGVNTTTFVSDWRLKDCQQSVIYVQKHYTTS